EQPLAHARAAAVRALAARLVAQRHAGAVREVLDCLGERQPVDAHHERDHIAALAASEAVPVPLPGAYVEAGGALVVERTEALQGADAGRLEGHVLADDLVDRRALAHRCDVVAIDSAGHAPSLRPA